MISMGYIDWRGAQAHSPSNPLELFGFIVTRKKTVQKKYAVKIRHEPERVWCQAEEGAFLRAGSSNKAFR